MKHISVGPFEISQIIDVVYKTNHLDQAGRWLERGVMPTLTYKLNSTIEIFYKMYQKNKKKSQALINISHCIHNTLAQCTWSTHVMNIQQKIDQIFIIYTGLK